MRSSEYKPSATARITDTMADVGRAGFDVGRDVATHVVAAGRCVNEAISYAREPGRPLDILSTVARKAPLSSLLIAVMIGISIGRRR